MRFLRTRPAWTAVAASLLALGTSVFSTSALAQTPACQVTYTKSWEGGNGFGANLVITVDSTTRPSRWIDWNQFNDELSYAQAYPPL